MTEATKRSVIVVGIDGSTHANAALDWASALARATDASLRVVASWETPRFFGRAVPREGYEPADAAHELLDKALADLDLPADRIETLAPMGPAGEVLVEASRDAAVLVVGAHGHSVGQTLLLGSTAGYCLHRAHCSVAIVR